MCWYESTIHTAAIHYRLNVLRGRLNVLYKDTQLYFIRISVGLSTRILTQLYWEKWIMTPTWNLHAEPTCGTINEVRESNRIRVTYTRRIRNHYLRRLCAGFQPNIRHRKYSSHQAELKIVVQWCWIWTTLSKRCSTWCWSKTGFMKFKYRLHCQTAQKRSKKCDQ